MSLVESEENVEATFYLEDADLDVKPNPAFLFEGLRRNSNVIVFDGFAYHTNYSTFKMRHLLCASRVALGCGARACIPLDGETTAVQIKKPHCHGPDPLLIHRTAFIQELKRRVVHQAGTIKSIYDQTCLDFPNASSLVAFQTIESKLRRVRATTQPNNPNNLMEYGDLISMNEWRRFAQTVNGRPFFSAQLEGADGSVAIIFSNPDLIEKISSSTQVHFDGSYIMEPALGDGKYFFSAHAIMHKHSNAIMYALMSSKTASLYTAVLSHLRQMAPNLKPTYIVCDYEKALYSTLREVFPNCPKIQGSYYHYLQHVYQKMASIGMLGISNSGNLIRNVMALPLLPIDKIAIGINVIDEIAKANLPSAMYNDLISYLDEQWWYGVSAPLMSVYNNPDATNNNIHMFHNTIRQRFQGVSNAWVFTEKLKEVECLTFRDFELLQGGHAIGRERKTKLLTSDDHLSRAWRMIETRRLPTVVFLERASEILRTIESQFRSIIDEYEEVELIQARDIAEVEIADRRLFTIKSEGIVYTMSNKRKKSAEVKTIPISVSKIKKEDPENLDSKVCIVCNDDDWEARCVLQPCGHKPLCFVCASRLATEKNKCPKCKRLLNGFYEFD